MDAIEIAPDPPLPPCLVIPFDAECVLPRRCLPVAALLQYGFPNPFAVPYDGAGIPVWSDSLPHYIHATLLLSCPVPQRETVEWLLSDIRQRVPTPRSFSRAAVLPCKVLPNHLPIWVLSFWDRLSEAYDTCLSWRKSLNWVNTACARHPAGQRLIPELDSLFQRVRWHGYLTGKRRDRCVKDIFDFLSNNELDSGQVGDLLELIERRLADTSDSRYLIAPTELAMLILYSHESHAEDEYRKQPIQQSVEEELIQRHRSAVASVSWTSVGTRGHWVPYIVDPIASTIFYGDPLGRRIPADLRDALQWWICDLRRRMGEPTTSPIFEPILATSQEDSFSCGILSTNSLLHHLLPHGFPLVSKDAVSIKMYRIERTIEILELSAEPVCMSLNVVHAR